MPFFQGSMPEYTGNKHGSFGSMNAKGGNSSKTPKRKGGNVSGSMNNQAKAPKRKGR